MAKKDNKYKDYDITTQAIHTGTDYDLETGAVRRPLHMAIVSNCRMTYRRSITLPQTF